MAFASVPALRSCPEFISWSIVTVRWNESFSPLIALDPGLNDSNRNQTKNVANYLMPIEGGCVN